MFDTLLLPVPVVKNITLMNYFFLVIVPVSNTGNGCS